MVFTQPVFLLFFILVYGVYWLAWGHAARKLWLLLASLFFYGFWDVRFLGLVALSIVIDYFAGLLIGGGQNEKPRRIWLIISLCANLGILGFFKYFNFFIESATEVARLLGMNPPGHVLQIILPVGVSFYTFQSMSYTIDVYRGHLKPVRSFTDFALFVMFFPQFVAGPIVRATTFLPQLDSKRHFSSIDFRFCLGMIFMGFFKKACVADNLAPFVDKFFDSPADFNQAGAWFAVVGYAIQIYCDFSGYTDMAIGLAGLLGYELTINFRHPYFASSITDFWRRWHISLSTWLRDYLYIPLGGNRGSKFHTARNIMLTMLLGGLWHGASWTFVLWGAVHGALLLANRHLVLPQLKRPWGRWLFKTGGVGITFFCVINAWVLFRAPEMSDAFAVFRQLYISIPISESGIPPGGLYFMLLLLTLHLGSTVERIHRVLRAIPDWAFAALLALGVLVILPWVSTQYKPFIYFQF